MTDAGARRAVSGHISVREENLQYNQYDVIRLSAFVKVGGLN
jgi:hypothetical protein